jgi:hypothetical protein
MKIGVCFGRFNPPHKGHKEAWKTASQFDNYYIGTNPTTNGPRDPLPYYVKHIVPEQNLFTLAAKIYAEFGEDVELQVCTDEDWLTRQLEKCNGIGGKHGYYKFNHIFQQKTPRLSSATDVRAAVLEGNRDLFSNAAGISADTEIEINNRVLKFFDIVGEYLE